MLLRAPAHRPLAVLHSGRSHARWSRWSVIAQPQGILRHYRGRTSWQSLGESCHPEPRFAHDPLIDLEWLDTRLAEAGQSRPAASASPVPWRGGWIGYLSYDLGRAIEPRSACANRGSQLSSWPLYEWLWCPELFVCDAETLQWHHADLSGAAEVEPDEVVASLELRECIAAAVSPAACLTGWTARQSSDQVARSVARTIEYIRAGDVFQANIAQQFQSQRVVNPRELAAAAWVRTPNWYSAYLECAADRQVLSLSPELFLEVDRTQRRITTRPLKGTLRSSQQRSSLERSSKDAAELNMIVDLMRNDLGRICEFGSVQVTQSRAIESHPTVHHGVATIEGRLREGIGFAETVRATFPPGSITGAPKIRAMQIIDELEPFERGPYCGSIGFVGADRISLNVAIRTMMIEDDVVTYGAGAGIVEESQPSRECDEMISKMAVVRGLSSSPAGVVGEAIFDE